MIKITTLLVLCLIIGFSGFSQSGRTIINLTDKEVIVASYTDSEIVIDGQTDLHLTADTKPLINSIIKLNSENSWVFIDNIRPQTVIDSLLQYVFVNNEVAVKGTNVRVSIFKHGAVIIPHSSLYKPLEVFTGQNFEGSSQLYSLYTYNNALGTFDNKIRSFRLKRGYMATLATNADGSGYSRVFIADKEDMLVSVMPDKLDETVSFIRVFSWEWASKKGWAGSNFNEYGILNATWRYDWSAGGTTTPFVEYVPIRQNGGWPGWSEINGKQNVTHVLGFNEPDHTEQSNLTVSQALAQWPEMMKSGLRIGSPACTGTGWIYQFMDSCDAHNYRVDFVAWHAYWGAKPAINWYNDLKAIHERTGRPLWITEWNNGANWTTEYWPDASKALTPANAAKQLADITNILQVLDTAHFIERYAIYNWVQDCRAMVLADTLTPAGKYYAADKSQMAFNRSTEVIPTWSFANPVLSILFSANTLASLLATNPNGEFNKGYKLERNIDNVGFTEVQDTSLTYIKYSEPINLSAFKKVRYRVRNKLTGGLESGYSNEIGFDITEGTDIQIGKFSFSNVTWNNIVFNQAYSAVPVIVFGSPTNNNFSVFMSNRVKQNNAYRFTFQYAPWAYQGVTTLSKEESIPYIILNPDTYDFGGLKTIAGKATVNATWTQITFATPFDTIPVVFTTQLTSTTINATGVRIKNVTKTGFQARIQKESAVSATPSSETVSYIAITPGTGIIDNKEIIVGRTDGAPVSGTAYTNILFTDTIENPVFIAQMQTCNDDTVTATLRVQSIYNTYARVIKQREKSTGITTMAKEDAGWMVINPVNSTTRLPVLKTTELRIYPNPVTDYLYFSDSFNRRLKVEIYNAFGALVMSEIVVENKVNVTDLKSGYYIVKTSNNSIAKFIKL